VANPDATKGAGGNAFALPPRQPTRLVKYSRHSKLVTAALSFTGFFALMYLLGQSTSPGIPPEVAKHHAPKIHSADSQGKNVGAPTNNGSMATNGGGPSIDNQQDDRSFHLSEAPDADLTDNTPLGDLPRIGDDGRQPWQVYSRPFNTADKRPRLAILVADLGLQRVITDAAVSRLPANVTLAFNVQSPAIGAWCVRARQEGHETLLSVPMEPFDFPHSDPGPHSLLTTLPNETNLERLNWALRQGAGYVGITTLTGSRFTTDSEKLKLVMQVLRDRGLMILDAHASPHSAVTDLAHSEHVPVATVNDKIDEDVSPEAIDAAFQQLEQTARLNGKAIGVVAPLPIIIDRLQVWLKTLPQDGIALAPLSAVTQ
jgi:polysaccharide deacetylase 2 family uncharacterized protein YibQ